MFSLDDDERTSFSLNQFTSRKVCLILFYLIITGFDILLAITCTKWEFLLMTIISNMFGWHSANFEVEKCSLRRFRFLLYKVWAMWRGYDGKHRELFCCSWLHSHLEPAERFSKLSPALPLSWNWPSLLNVFQTWFLHL